jgi:uncharacterized protein
MRMLIDGHTHIGLPTFLSRPISAEKLTRPAFQDRMENTVEDLLAKIDANSIQKAVVFGFPLEEIDHSQANSYVMEAYHAYPERIIPFALISDEVKYWLKQGIKGFKQQDILYASQRFDLPRAYSIIAEAGVPMLIHFRAGKGYSVPEQVKAILKEVPDLKLIIAHMGRHVPNTGQGVEEALTGLQGFPNVFFETSTVRDSSVIERAVALIGAERILFGSDFPFNSFQDDDPLAEEISIVEQADISSNSKGKIFSQNIQQLLGLGEYV